MDSSGSTAWSYDIHGRVTGKTQAMGAVTLSMQYSYDTSGRLLGVTIPRSGAITYGWSNGQVTSLALYGGTLLSNIAWQPFNGVKSFGYTIGGAEARSYDLDGRLGATGAESQISYDNASRISSISDGASLLNYGYDALDRLSSFSDGYNSNTYTYDAAGNRLTRTSTPWGEPAVTTTYTPALNSNRLAQISSGGSLVTLLYDANGSITQDVTGNYSYDAAGHLASASSSFSMSAAATYTYNGLGQRVKKQVGGVTTLYYYDEEQHLIGEYDGAGYLINETVYLGNLPVAAVQYENVYTIRADHLNTPRGLYYAGSVGVWAWSKDDFGETQADSDPSRGGFDYPVDYSLRFPGQVFDAETGLHYNMNRYYNPATGTYLESDPIGLGGGINTYVYVLDGPTNYSDLLGLLPGDRYPSSQAAGIAAECQYNPLSIQEDLEYGGSIYMNWDGTYSYTEPNTGSVDTVIPAEPPLLHSLAGIYHTHAAYHSKYGINNFTFSYPDDFIDPNAADVPAFLGTTNGDIKEYVPIQHQTAQQQISSAFTIGSTNPGSASCSCGK